MFEKTFPNEKEILSFIQNDAEFEKTKAFLKKEYDKYVEVLEKNKEANNYPEFCQTNQFLKVHKAKQLLFIEYMYYLNSLDLVK